MQAKAERAAHCEALACKIIDIVGGEKVKTNLTTMLNNLSTAQLRALLDARWNFIANPIEKYTNAKKEVLVDRAVQYLRLLEPCRSTVDKGDNEYVMLEKQLKKRQAGSTSTTSMDASNAKAATKKPNAKAATKKPNAKAATKKPNAEAATKKQKTSQDNEYKFFYPAQKRRRSHL